MPKPTDGADRSNARIDIPFAVGLVLVFVGAVTVRLVVVLRGGGLGGLGNYDDGVYFAAAIGLVHGVVPYRDFLLLHPPGIAVLLSPFAQLARLVGDPTAMTLARLAWMCLGGVNALLVGLVIRPLGRSAALLAALFYAVFYPAIYTERTTLLEAPATTAVLGSLAMLAPFSPVRRTTSLILLAGALIGLSPAIKIWGVVTVVVVACWVLVLEGWRRTLIFVAGAVASCALVCLPFFLLSPGRMWRMVVYDQAIRQSGDYQPLARLQQIVGVAPLHQTSLVLAVCIVAWLVVAGALVVCILRRELRPLAALFGTALLVLGATQVWFPHYAALTAAPLALLLGGAGSVVLLRLGRAGGRRAVLAVVLASGVGLSAAGAVELAMAQTGGLRFPGPALAAAVAQTPGCIQTDMPMASIQMNVASRNVERRCRFEVDLGGWSRDLGSAQQQSLPRARNPLWQQFALDYLSSGDLALVARFNTTPGFSAQTKRAYQEWPTVERVGPYTLRDPPD